MTGEAGIRMYCDFWKAFRASPSSRDYLPESTEFPPIPGLLRVQAPDFLRVSRSSTARARPFL
jgi:hypothetical protein